MQSIAEAAMALPEICSLVIRKIDSPGGLARAARVNNAWHKEAIKSLWKGITTVDRLWDPDFKRWRTPNLDFLCGLGRAPARFRHYIQHVKYLDLWRRHPGTASNDAWILSQADLWTSLSCISLSLFRIRMSIDPWRTIAFLLKPSLRALELGDYMLSQPLMMDIKVSGLSLRGLKEGTDPSSATCLTWSGSVSIWK